jgi:hypothetical protein
LPILRFEVDNGQIVSFVTWVFPIPNELHMWIHEEPLDIKENKFQYSMTSGNGEFMLEGEFISENLCTGLMKFTSGFLLVDITLNTDVTIPWTAQPEM